MCGTDAWTQDVSLNSTPSPFFYFLFWIQVLQVAQAGLELTVLLPLPKHHHTQGFILLFKIYFEERAGTWIFWSSQGKGLKTGVFRWTGPFIMYYAKNQSFKQRYCLEKSVTFLKTYFPILKILFPGCMFPWHVCKWFSSFKYKTAVGKVHWGHSSDTFTNFDYPGPVSLYKISSWYLKWCRIPPWAKTTKNNKKTKQQNPLFP